MKSRPRSRFKKSPPGKNLDLAHIHRRLRETGDFITKLALLPLPGARGKNPGPEIAPDLLRLTSSLSQTIASGNKIMIFGNGGSAAAAQHLSSELVNRLNRKRAALPALALTTDSSIITSISNDQEFTTIFSRQLEALARPGDAALAISTSGRSPNIIHALKTARTLGLNRIALLGGDGGPARRLAELKLIVPSRSVPLIQEVQLIIAHLICELLEKNLPLRKPKKSASRPRKNLPFS